MHTSPHLLHLTWHFGPERYSASPVDNTAFLPILLPELSGSGWFSVGLGARKLFNTNDLLEGLLRGGGSENRKVGGSTPPLVPRQSWQGDYFRACGGYE